MPDFYIDLIDHNIGDKNCNDCWPGFPIKCKCVGGLIHAEFGDEDMDCNYYLLYKCDKCGDDYIFEEE